MQRLQGRMVLGMEGGTAVSALCKSQQLMLTAPDGFTPISGAVIQPAWGRKKKLDVARNISFPLETWHCSHPNQLAC